MIINGSGWTIKSITGVFVNIAAWRPFRGGGATRGDDIQLQVPWQIRNSKCVINLRTQNSKCFQFAAACSAFYHEIKEKKMRPNNLSSYKDYISKLNFEGMNFPVKHTRRSYEIFEKLNPEYALNILTLETNEFFTTKPDLKAVKVLLKKRKAFNIQVSRTSPFHQTRKPLYLLLLYNAKTGISHYTSVTKIDVLLSHNSNTLHKGKSIVCFACKQRFRGDNRVRNFSVHKNYCKTDICTRNLFKSSYYRQLGDVTNNENRSICLNCHISYEGGTKKERLEYLKKHQKSCFENPPALGKVAQYFFPLKKKNGKNIKFLGAKAWLHSINDIRSLEQKPCLIL